VSIEANKVRIFFNQILSDAVAPAAYRVMRHHLKKILGEDVEETLVSDPKKFYNALKSLYVSERMIIQLDSVICIHLQNKYNIIVDDMKIFGKLKYGDLREFGRIVDEYLLKKGYSI